MIYDSRFAIYDFVSDSRVARKSSIEKLKMIIGLLQLNSTIGDFAANAKKLLAGYEKAVALGAEFILAPELFLCGYPPRDLLLREDFIDANLFALEETAKKCRRSSAVCRFR
jgi:NAD+ synthase (glutamine-hydrolysing)